MDRDIITDGGPLYSGAEIHFIGSSGLPYSVSVEREPDGRLRWSSPQLASKIYLTPDQVEDLGDGRYCYHLTAEQLSTLGAVVIVPPENA